MTDTDLRDFACPACWGWLPDYPVHTDRGAYCSNDCRDATEPELLETIAEDLEAEAVFVSIPPCPFEGPAAFTWQTGWHALQEVPY